MLALTVSDGSMISSFPYSLAATSGIILLVRLLAQLVTCFNRAAACSGDFLF